MYFHFAFISEILHSHEHDQTKHAIPYLSCSLKPCLNMSVTHCKYYFNIQFTAANTLSTTPYYIWQIMSNTAAFQDERKSLRKYFLGGKIFKHRIDQSLRKS